MKPETRNQKPEESETRSSEAERLLRVAELLRYPTQTCGAGVLARAEGDDDSEIAEFFAETAHVDATGLEELYTTTFDLNPVATLEAGWHLWGEQYERGRFLADLRGLQTQFGIEAGTELPDHLTVLLPTLAALPEDDDLRENCAKAIEKILKALDEQGNPYRHLLRAALETIGERAPQGELVISSRADGEKSGAFETGRAVAPDPSLSSAPPGLRQLGMTREVTP